MKEETEPKGMWKPADVARRLNIGESTVYHWAHKGVLKGIKLEGVLRFEQADVEKFVEQMKAKSLGTAA